jgi:hypothetical protein
MILIDTKNYEFGKRWKMKPYEWVELKLAIVIVIVMWKYLGKVWIYCWELS